MKDTLTGPAFEMPEAESAALKLLLPVTRTGVLPFDESKPQARRWNLDFTEIFPVSQKCQEPK